MAGKKHAISNHRMAADQRAIRKDVVIADHRVVAHVTVRHEKVARSNHRIFLQRVGTMERHVFTNHIVIPHAQSGGFPLVLEILRRISDDRAGMNDVVRAYLGVTGKMGMRTDPAVGTHAHIRINHRIRPHLHGFVQLGFRINHGRRVNHANPPIPKDGSKPKLQIGHS